MRTVAARTLKVSVIVASLMVFGQLSAQATPQVVSEQASLDATGFFPGGWDRNDLRSDVIDQGKDNAQCQDDKGTSMDGTGFFPGGWDRNDLRSN